MAIFLSKISVLCLELRLSPERIQVLVVRVSLAFSGVALFAAIFMVALGCDVAHPWLQITDECNGLVSSDPTCDSHNNLLYLTCNSTHVGS